MRRNGCEAREASSAVDRDRVDVDDEKQTAATGGAETLIRPGGLARSQTDAKKGDDVPSPLLIALAWTLCG